MVDGPCEHTNTLEAFSDHLVLTEPIHTQPEEEHVEVEVEVEVEEPKETEISAPTGPYGTVFFTPKYYVVRNALFL